jgi:hypothetical protein
MVVRAEVLLLSYCSQPNSVAGMYLRSVLDILPA